MTTSDNTASTIENGTTVFIPLNKLKKHPKNARKTPHSVASIEAKAASIAKKGILQNLVVEPETDAEGGPTGFYLVSIGEGRRLAQMLHVKRKEIKKTEPIRCVINMANDAAEISLDENVKVHGRRIERRDVFLACDPGVDEIGPFLHHVAALVLIFRLVVDTA